MSKNTGVGGVAVSRVEDFTGLRESHPTATTHTTRHNCSGSVLEHFHANVDGTLDLKA